MKIYLNGILDSLQELQGRNIETNEEPLYIGSHPSYLKACKTTYYIDNLKIFSVVLPQFAIQAEAYGALGFIAPNKIMLGCQKCAWKDALKSCIKHYHLCTNGEITSGVYQAIRIMGWVRFLSNSS